MRQRAWLWSSVLAISLALLLVTSQTSLAESQADSRELATSGQNFEAIEQPASLKVGVTLAGVALISLELWWFLGQNHSKP